MASGEVGPAGSVKEHGRLGLAEDTVGHAAEHRPTETAPAGRGHRDQVGAESVRLLEDLVERVAEADARLDGDPPSRAMTVLR